MPETLLKLSPHRDLQCYFERPSAIAAISDSHAGGFTLSGSWRQQFDWAVVEWNRDNVFEHPAFRNLPDGDLSGLRLSYEEERINCVPLNSELFPTVDWPSLRIWAETAAGEQLFKVPLRRYAIPVAGSYQCASVEFTLSGSITAGDYAGLAWPGEHHTYQVYATDSVESIIQALADSINAFSTTMKAEFSGASIRVFYTGGQTVPNGTTGTNGNRLGVYTRSTGSGSLQWNRAWAYLDGGSSPSRWKIDLDFSTLQDVNLQNVPMNAVRKMRWTYAADLQSGSFQRSEFSVKVRDWTVTGSNRGYKVAGPGSRRIEDGEFSYSNIWAEGSGNFSGGTIHHTVRQNASAACTYTSPVAHALYLGTRFTFNAASVEVKVDGAVRTARSLFLAGEDALARIKVAELGPGSHTVTIKHTGPEGNALYLDYLEVAVPSGVLPLFPASDVTTLATDWDTDHSIALPAERTAWMMASLGFQGRANHYVGALWFYELYRKGHEYASASVTFEGTPSPNLITTISVGSATLQHLNLVGDTAATIAKAFELEINRGYTAIRATAENNVLTIFARAMGTEGNSIGLSTANSGGLTATVSGSTLAGGVDGTWTTDLQAVPRLNRAARDWTRTYFAALKGYGIDGSAAFSMELQHGDSSVEAGIVQRYPSLNPVLLTTPAIQTNFSPASTAFWKQVYLDAAIAQQEAGVQPYLQFGEVQWWYFPYDGSGLPFYDEYSRNQFLATHGRSLPTITSNATDPSAYSEEVSFLSSQIGEFTAAVMQHVRATVPTCRFEVLYPPDVNDTAFNRAVNYPANYWSEQTLDCLKTESFTYTYSRNLNMSRESMRFSAMRGFPAAKRSHLVGISDPTTAWLKEQAMAEGEGCESVVLFALDQFCLIGYAAHADAWSRRSFQLT